MLGQELYNAMDYEFERADELTAPLGIHALFVPTEVSTEELRELDRKSVV